MSILPVIKTELKRNIWVAWVGALLFILLTGGRLNNELSETAYDLTINFCDLYIDPTVLYVSAATCMAIWVSLFVFVQFGKDYLLFKKALPYTDKKLLLSKFTAFLAVLGIVDIVFAAIIVICAKRYDYLFELFKVLGPDQYGCGYISVPGMVFTAAAATAAALAIYWFLVFCCCICRNSVHGCMLGMLIAAALISFDVFLNNLSSSIITFQSLTCSEKIALWLKGISPYAYAYTYPTVGLVLAVVLAAIAAALAFGLYGGGESAHPLFRYGFGSPLAITASTLLCGSIMANTAASLTPTAAANMLYFTLGAVIGGGFAAAIDHIVRRRYKK